MLLATFSEPLARSLEMLLRRLLRSEPRLGERIEVWSTHGIAQRLYQANFGRAHLAVDEDVQRRLEDAAAGVEGHRFSPNFLWAEWSSVVDAWQIESWEEYRTVPRLGRKTRLGEVHREILWRIFEAVRDGLAAEGLLTMSGVLRRLEVHLRSVEHQPFDFAVVDEAQDLGVADLRFLAALAGDRPDGLFFAGDLGQRIFQTPFSWLKLGVDVRGRSHTLRINYRTSHQIREQADRLLPPEVADVDGIVETRGGTLSAFNGPPPEIRVLGSEDEEAARVTAWLRERVAQGIPPEEIGVFVRSEAELLRARAAIVAAGLQAAELSGNPGAGKGGVGRATMHLAKGLEFRAVAVLACDDEIVPRSSHESKPWRMKPTSRTSTTRSATSCTWPAPEPGSTCW